MFPFDYIPPSIDGTMRQLIISLIIVQFIAFLLLILYLTYDYLKIKFDSTIKIPIQEESKESDPSVVAEMDEIKEEETQKEDFELIKNEDLLDSNGKLKSE